MPVSSVPRHVAGPKATPARILGLMLAASVAIIAIALGFEFIGNYRPCPLCLQQRHAYYFAIGAAVAGLLGDRAGVGSGWLRVLLALIAVGYLVNTGLGIQHAGVEWKWWAGPDTCSAALPKLSGGTGLDLSQPVIRCDAAPWRLAGLSFAGWNAALSLGLAALAALGAYRR